MLKAPCAGGSPTPPSNLNPAPSAFSVGRQVGRDSQHGRNSSTSRLSSFLAPLQQGAFHALVCRTWVVASIATSMSITAMLEVSTSRSTMARGFSGGVSVYVSASSSANRSGNANSSHPSPTSAASEPTCERIRRTSVYRRPPRTPERPKRKSIHAKAG